MAKRKLSKWNMFVKKIFKEGRGKNSNFKFKDALKEASDRKEEMGNDSSHSSSSSSSSHKKMDKKTAGKRRRSSKKRTKKSKKGMFSFF